MYVYVRDDQHTEIMLFQIPLSALPTISGTEQMDVQTRSGKSSTVDHHPAGISSSQVGTGLHRHTRGSALHGRDVLGREAGQDGSGAYNAVCVVNTFLQT